MPVIRIQCNFQVASFTRSKVQKKPFTRRLIDVSGGYTFKYDYPLSKEAKFVHSLVTPSAADILHLARNDYRRIYQEEDAASGPTPNVPGMLNRGASSGPYGIWGHDLEDLFFECIEIDTDNKVVTFAMGS